MKKNSSISFIAWGAFIAGIIIIALSLALDESHKYQSIAYSAFRESAEQGKIESLTVQGLDLKGRLNADYAKEKKLPVTFSSVGPVTDEIQKELSQSNTLLKYKAEEKNSLDDWLPFIIFSVLISVLLFFMFRHMLGSGQKALSFGESRARLLQQNQKVVTFADIAGIEEAKQELIEIVDFLKEPEKYTKLGGKIPRGVLLLGRPGTGKTLLARGVAGEAGVAFFSLSGSDFVEMFIGVGASRVRDLFAQAKRHAPCIIFIDEIDAIGRRRGTGGFNQNEEREQTLNQLLVEMDGFEPNENVIIIAATNRPDTLDPALTRPGRFDRRVHVPTPDVRGREEILKIHTRKNPLSPDIDLKIIAKGTPGFSGADLANLVNEAALWAARNQQSTITNADFEFAKDKIIMGSERKSAVLTEESKRVTAYHEAGHTLVALMQPGTDPIHKVSIIPRGHALGVTQQLPDEDRYSTSYDYAVKRLAVMMGGRAAEKIVFNQRTTGAGNDIEVATDLAIQMVCSWGMSDIIGPIAYHAPRSNPFGYSSEESNHPFSEATAQKIDAEVAKLLINASNTAERIISENRDKLNLIAEALIEFESLDREDIEDLLANQSNHNIRTRREARLDELVESISKNLEAVESKGKKEDDTHKDKKESADPNDDKSSLTKIEDSAKAGLAAIISSGKKFSEDIKANIDKKKDDSQPIESKEETGKTVFSKPVEAKSEPTTPTSHDDQETVVVDSHDTIAEEEESKEATTGSRKNNASRRTVMGWGIRDKLIEDVEAFYNAEREAKEKAANGEETPSDSEETTVEETLELSRSEESK